MTESSNRTPLAARDSIFIGVTAFSMTTRTWVFHSLAAPLLVLLAFLTRVHGGRDPKGNTDTNGGGLFLSLEDGRDFGFFFLCRSCSRSRSLARPSARSALRSKSEFPNGKERNCWNTSSSLFLSTSLLLRPAQNLSLSLFLSGRRERRSENASATRKKIKEGPTTRRMAEEEEGENSKKMGPIRLPQGIF